VLLLVHVKNGDRSFPLGLSKPLWDRGYNLLIFDLRGHGQSDGGHYSYGQYEQFDIVGAVDFVKGKGFQPGGIGIIGWSMGAASSIMAMGQTTDIRAGVSDSSYGDLTRVAGQRLGMLLFFYPGMVAADRLLYNIDIDQVKPEAALKKLGNRHLFLIHGDADVTVPVSEVFHLKEAGGSNIADTWILPGVGHAGAYNANEAEYLRRVTNFIDKELI
jgi:dipeptidyl aminopeptidase/acylaminoacyl peptidase